MTALRQGRLISSDRAEREPVWLVRSFFVGSLSVPVAVAVRLGGGLVKYFAVSPFFKYQVLCRK